MISRDLRVEHIAPRHFANLVRLFDPPEGLDPPPEGGGAYGLFDRLTGAARSSSTTPIPGGDDDVGVGGRLSWVQPVVVLLRGGKVVRLVRLGGGGALAAGTLKSADPADLRAFRRKHHLPFVVALELDALPRLWADAQAAVHLDDDLVAQQLAMLRVLLRAVSVGEVVVEPRLLGNVPLPPFGVVQATFDRVLPDRRSFVFYVLDRQRLWTSLIAVKREGDIQLLTTHRAIAADVRFGSISRDAPRVIDAVTTRYEPPHIGIFITLSCWNRLVGGDRAAIARAVSSRQARIDPCPPWLAALVGVGAVSEAASQSMRFAGRLLSRSGLLPGGAGRLLSTVTSPLEGLGIDPWEAIAWSRDWSRRVLPLLVG